MELKRAKPPISAASPRDKSKRQPKVVYGHYSDCRDQLKTPHYRHCPYEVPQTDGFLPSYF